MSAGNNTPSLAKASGHQLLTTRWRREEGRDENTKKKFCVKQRCVPKIFRLLLGLCYIPGQHRAELSSAIGSANASMCAKLRPDIAGQGYSNNWIGSYLNI